MTPTRSAKPPEKARVAGPAVKKLKATSLGDRIKNFREDADMTQSDLAKTLGRAGLGRSKKNPHKVARTTIAQWERDSSQPDFQTVEFLAKLFNTKPEVIAFDVNSKATNDDFTLIPEIVFGERVNDSQIVLNWGCPISWLRNEMNAQSYDELLIYKVPYQTVAEYSAGDRIMVDRSVTKISPPGNFLVWDGVSTTVAHVGIASVKGSKVTARVKTLEDTHEIDADKLHVIGRVLGAYKKI